MATSEPPCSLAGRVFMLATSVGGSYALGGAGGALLHSVKGLLGSGEGGRLAAAARAARLAGPRVGGAFAATTAALCAFDFLFSSLRRKSEVETTTMTLAGAATAGLTFARHGPLAAGFSSLAAGAAAAALLDDD